MRLPPMRQLRAAARRALCALRESRVACLYTMPLMPPLLMPRRHFTSAIF